MILGSHRVPRETEPLEKRGRRGRVLPEHVDLGLRLTVGEGVLKKPFLESTHGEGHFPEMSAQTEPSQNAYFPKLAGLPGKQRVGDSKCISINFINYYNSIIQYCCEPFSCAYSVLSQMNTLCCKCCKSNLRLHDHVETCVS